MQHRGNLPAWKWLFLSKLTDPCTFYSMVLAKHLVVEGVITIGFAFIAMLVTYSAHEDKC